MKTHTMKVSYKKKEADGLILVNKQLREFRLNIQPEKTEGQKRWERCWSAIWKGAKVIALVLAMASCQALQVLPWNYYDREIVQIDTTFVDGEMWIQTLLENGQTITTVQE